MTRDELFEKITDIGIEFLEKSVFEYARPIWEVIGDEVVSAVLEYGKRNENTVYKKDIGLAIGGCLASYLGISPALIHQIGCLREPAKKDTVEAWRCHKFSTGVEPGPDYLEFQKLAKKELRKMAIAAGFKLHSFSQGHYHFTAVLKDSESPFFVFISMQDVRCQGGEWFTNVLYHTMAHEKDWAGGENNFCAWNNIVQALISLKSTSL